MIIKKAYKKLDELKGKEFDDKELHSFKEVFDYCMEKLSLHTPAEDSIVFRFIILDSGEVFTVVGKADGEDSYVVRNIDF